jgi:hypothetical protein
MANEHVGVNVIEGLALSPISGVSTAVTGIIGTFKKGPLNQVTLVTSFAQFERIFGSEPAPGSTSYYSVKAFFAKAGNAPLNIVRVAGTGVLKANYTALDRQGTPANTLKIEAKSEGLWGNGISVKILDHAILSTKPAVTFGSAATEATLVATEGLEIGSDLKFYNGTQTEYKRLTNVDHAAKKVYWTGGLTNTYTTVNGVITSLEFSIEVYWNGVLVETLPGFSMNNAVSFHVVKKLRSEYIVATDLKATDTDYTDLPAVISTPQVLASGNDGLSGILAADYVGTQSAKTGVYAFDAVPDLFRFACPNPLLTDAVPATAYEQLVQSLLDYANLRGTVQFYGDIPYGNSVTNALAFGQTFVGRRVCFFWPWLKVVEKGLDLWLPPSTFALGAAVNKDYNRGVHKNIGNESVAYAIDLEYDVSVAEGEVLNDGSVNTIRSMTGRGIVIYGGRCRSAVTAFRFLHCSEYWNYIAKSLEVNTQDVPFEPNNVTLWKTVVRRISAFLANEQKRGALFDASNPTGPAYSVVMDETNNPADQIALGIARVQVEYVPTGTAEKFIIELTSSPAGLSSINQES